MIKKEHDYMSNFSTALFEPLVLMMGKLNSIGECKKDVVQVGNIENGYSIAAIILMALILESVISRSTIVYNDSDEEYSGKILEYFRSTCKIEALVDGLEDVFVVRDVIAHNHHWSAKTHWDHEGLKMTETELLKGFGNQRYFKRVDVGKRKTKFLDLNVFPTKIGKRDARIIFKTFNSIIQEYEKERKTGFNNWSVHFQDEYISYKDFSEKMEKF